MGLETGTYISDLNSAWPLGSDQKSTTDDHLRLIKSFLKASFPNVNGAVNPTPTEFNYLVGVTSGIQAQIAAKGAITGQTWTGSHNFPTQSQGNNSTLAATTAYVDTGLATKGAISGQAWTGTQNFTGATITATTQTQGDNSTKAATTAYVDAYSPLGNFIRIATSTASASASISFTGLSSTYDCYVVELINIKPATTGASLWMRTSANNGVSYDSGASDYAGLTMHINTSTVVTPAQFAASAITLHNSLSSARAGFSGYVHIITPSSTNRCHIRSEGAGQENGASQDRFYIGSWCRDSAAAVNAIQFLMSSGNITSGTINLYGRRKT